MEQKMCPCDSKIAQDACCISIMQGKTIATTPEQLMRSRYTAFCMQNVDYLAESYHLSKRPSHYASQLASHIHDTQWLGLRVIQSGIEKNAPHRGFVEFIAYHTDAKDTSSPILSCDVQQLHERSFFVKENGRWFYVEGDSLPAIKLQRNDPCWCNSGKKIKKCHGC